MHFHQFLAHLTHQRRVSPHTVTAYTGDLEQFAEYCKTAHSLQQTSEVTRGHVKSWLANLMVQDLAPASIRRKLSALKAFYAYQQARGMQRENPTLRIPTPKLSRRLPTSVADQDMRRLFAAFPDPQKNTDFSSLRDHLLLSLLYQCGLRRAELIGLREYDVDLDQRRLNVRGKGDKQRLVPFGKGLLEIMECYGALKQQLFTELKTDHL
ncbi:MAG: site-specific integrase, partial [Bacteroidota bacterium]